ncbi:MAG: hypothetical protein HYV95_07370 [Opitutae bacterium]|nr:hypothetical protein [Opitutae bacterium]
MYVSVFAQEGETKPAYYTAQEFKSWEEKLRGFDEIRMTLAEKWVSYPKKMNKDGSFEYGEKRVLESLIYANKSITDSDVFFELLMFDSRMPKLAHGCYGLFNLAFYRKGELVGRLHYAHGQYWHPLLPISQLAINQWLIQHGFPVEETLKLDKRG